MKFQCKQCGTPLGYDGLCWKCRSEEKRNEVLAWSEQEIVKKLNGITTNAEKLGSYKNPKHDDFQHLLAYHGIASPEVYYHPCITSRLN